MIKYCSVFQLIQFQNYTQPSVHFYFEKLILLGIITAYSTWSQWGQCQGTCGMGSQSRTRTCQGGSNCPGSSFETRQCNTNIPCIIVGSKY